MQNNLIVITGPTASGKTGVAVSVASALGCDIISADSRQIFREIPVGTAAPSAEEQQGVRHHFIGSHSITDYFSAAEFERQVTELIPSLGPVSVLAGGSMMYVDAVCNGIDDLPTISPGNRERATAVYEGGGLQRLRLELLEMDPEYYREVDLNNPKRIIHALEIMYQSGRKYSALRTGSRKKRPFTVTKYALNIPRDELFERINRRVDSMLENGLLQEAERMYPYRSYNSLNTVGYKELFAYMNGEYSLSTAIEKIKKNTRVFAKKQLTWLKKDTEIIWLDPASAAETIIKSYHKT